MPVFKSDHIGIYYEEVGGGEPVVFLHGLTGSTADWKNQMDLVKRRYNGIAMDFRGHGRSDAPSSEEDYSIDLFTEDVYRLLMHLDIEACGLVGHSMGGFTALQFTLDHADLVKALVLVDTCSGQWDVDPGYPAVRAKLDELAFTEGLEAAFEYDAAHNPVRIENFKKHPDRRGIARQKVLQTSAEGYVYVPRSFSKWRPVTNRLGEIKVPTLIFRGEEDTPFIRPTEILHDGIAGSRLEIVPDAWHHPHQENPAFFNDHFSDFLSGVDLTQISRRTR